MIAQVEGGRIVAVRGDRDHPVSGGYTCAKGRAIPVNHHAANRLDSPVMGARAVSWDACLDDLGTRLRDVLARSGPDGIAHYRGMGLYTDTTGWWALERLFALMGSAQTYTTYTVDMATVLRACELVIGFPLLPYWTPEDTDTTLAVLIGTNPGVSHGHSVPFPNPTHRLREYRRKGGELWVIDPRATKSAALADHHLAPQPGTDAFILAWLVREVLDSGADEAELALRCRPDDVAALRAAVAPFTLDKVAQASGLAPDALVAFLDAIRRHRRLAILPGTGVSFSPNAIVTEWLRLALLIVTGSLDAQGGMRFSVSGMMPLEQIAWSGHARADGTLAPGPRSRPELGLIVGQRPSVALVDEIEAGTIRALIVAGANPLAALPQPARLRAALRKLETLVLIDCFEGELAEIATHVLPSTWQMERPDMFLSQDRSQFCAAVVPAAHDRMPAWWIIGQLAERSGHPFLGEGQPVAALDDERVMRAMMATSRHRYEDLARPQHHGIALPRVFGWVRDNVLEHGRWRLVPPALSARLADAWAGRQQVIRMITGRRMNSNNSAHYAEPDGAAPAIAVSPDVAQANALADGAVVRVVSATGSVRGPVRIDASLAAGTVWVPHGWAQCNVNDLITGAQVDPLHGQPVQSGLPVTIEALAGARGER